MGNLASTLHYLGQLKRAEEMEREVLASRTSILGAQHPDTIIAKDNLARTLKTLAGRKKKSKKGVERQQ
ncbi:hypothetical protein FRC17_009986 [Serendipita sp. 399]|nr:hypothetical protein FRC17_009986 [Serendipita sp. 399]